MPSSVRQTRLSPIPSRTSPATATRQRIVTAARHHFLAHGFRGVTMDDLAVELGMSKKTLYAHFPSKAALLRAVIDHKLRSAEADLREVAAESSANYPAALHHLLAALRKHSEELQPAFLRDIAREAPELFAMVQIRRRALIRRHLGKLLSEGRKAGMIRTDIATDLMIEILIGATDALIHPQKLAELDLPARTGLMAIIAIFLEGVTTGKRRRK
jgi:AcrR family transcriptional regulator